MNKVKSLALHPPEEATDFSICTLVTDQEEYKIMKDSFERAGFSHNCEYIIADNSLSNQFDAYQAISLFIKTAQSKYIIIVHQDVLCEDTRAQLETCLQNLEAKDKTWAVCGNAGAKGYHDAVIHLTGPRLKETYKGLPEKVNSLDENFLVLNKRSNISISSDLTGFHLYGTDLCIVAQVLGHSCYVIPFMVKHMSDGNLTALKKYTPGFIKKWGKKLEIGYLQTTCTQFYLSNSARKTSWFNSPFLFFLIKQSKRWPSLLKGIGKENRRTRETL